MTISKRAWQKYIAALRKCSDEAARRIYDFWIKSPPVTLQDWTALIDYAFALSTKYGEAAAAAACEMYDDVARISSASIAAALPAQTATYQEVAAAVRSAGKNGNGDLVGYALDRLVKQAGADTTLSNAARDGAEWAWIPHGDTCAFCLTLASRGWQRQGKKAAKGKHASHIHANCDCTYAVRFDSSGGVAGYDPDEYKYLYDNASASQKSNDKINALRRDYYSRHADEINAQKRAAYRERVEREKVSKLGTDT